jgi:hypothetical protein
MAGNLPVKTGDMPTFHRSVDKHPQALRQYTLPLDLPDIRFFQARTILIRVPRHRRRTRRLRGIRTAYDYIGG